MAKMDNGFRNVWGNCGSRAWAATGWRAICAKPTIGQRILGGLIAAIILGLLVLILVPALVIGMAVMLLGAGAYGVRSAISRLRGKERIADGRRNVRVIVRDDAVV